MTRFRFVPARSVVLIDARSTLHPISSRTDGLEGFIDLDVDAGGALDAPEAAAGAITLPVDRLRSGNPLQDRELQRRIDARRFPTITGTLTSIAADDRPDRFRVSGDLTFRGVTRSYEDELIVSLEDDQTLRVEGEATFDIRDFGMNPPRILMLRVEPTVRVRVELVAEREISAA